MSPRTILIADDDPALRASLATTLELEGFRVETAADGRQAVTAVERGGIDLVVLDLQMPQLDGIGALRELRQRGFALPAIFLSAHGTIERAVEALRLGAWDFVEKPARAERLLVVVGNALRQSELELENRELRQDAESHFEMVGDSPAMRGLFQTIERVAQTAARVLVLGENGSGKELIARALHRLSTRAAAPFVSVNCAAIPAELFESELFGHERGAFTGATQRRRGRFARAHRGTLFLDEVAELPLALQAKLLRVLESASIEPVGSDRETPVDVRLVAATNRDLEQAMTAGQFRRDLYYRLQVVTVVAPPLRERIEDLPALVGHFLQRVGENNHLPGRRLTDDALDRLRRYDFPGNVRELRNLIERLVILTPGTVIDGAAVDLALPRRPPVETELPWLGDLRTSLEACERRYVRATLERCAWNMTAAAEALGLERSHLYRKLRALGISRQH